MINEEKTKKFSENTNKGLPLLKYLMPDYYNERMTELNNEYDYSLDQSNGILTLTDDDESYRFVAQ